MSNASPTQQFFKAVDNSGTMNDIDDQHSEVSEEEEECRVCRGPAEEGRPLYAPCKCSGSIGLTHQDCLTSWLAVTRGIGRCELCGMKFQFAPKYKEGTPDHLGLGEVILGLFSRVVQKWMPLALRIVFAASLWLGVVPLATTYLYHGWMHRPSSIITRLEWELVPGDLVSGLVITAFIIVTFLSFMSFADFLRFNWQQPGEGNRQGANRRQEAEETENDRDTLDLVLLQMEVINRLKQCVSRAASRHLQASQPEGYDPDDEVEMMRTLHHEMQLLIRPKKNEVPTDPLREQELQRHSQTTELLRRLEDLVDNRPNSFSFRAQRGTPGDDRLQNIIEDLFQEEFRGPPVDRNNRDAIENRQFAPNDDGFVPPLQGVNPDDDMDMDLNIALDELLGLRGPFNILIRNVFWLLAFNTTYLGLFAFIPKNFGSAVYSVALNRTALTGWMANETSLTPDWNDGQNFGRLITILNEESNRLDTTLRLPDLTAITLGYLSMALLVVLLHAGVFLYGKLAPHTPQTARRNADVNGHARRQQRDAHHPHVLRDEGAAERQRNEAAFFRGVDEREMDEIVGGLGEQLSVALDCLKALTKVGFLLFHKMLLLPLVLGVWLDTATLAFFGSTMIDRALYAGSDLFSSALLHWVAGITFMLFVTVSVLQLREVAHPDLLARIIRPQEPQPDLLSNLLHESLVTHAKRMLLSFAIYAALLSLHVWLPARILVVSGAGKYLPFSRLRFAYVLMPQLQAPLELLVFHLTMLALLEKYKNRIGEMQHAWLRFLCDKMSLTQYVLPRSVDRFMLVGSRPIFTGPGANTANSRDNADALPVDPFWFELAVKKTDVDEFILSHVTSREEQPVFTVGVTQTNGQRVPEAIKARIVLPPPSAQKLEVPVAGRMHLSTFLPTTIGSFRLVRKSKDEKLVIEFWQEVAGDPIARPPEGWDDLGVGGAEVQKRWAWGKEKKSEVEHGIARRTPFAEERKYWASSLSLFLKGNAVFILSWLVMTVMSCAALAFPLAVGRAIHMLLRIPDRYVHDPLAFTVGLCLLSSSSALLSTLWWRSEHPVSRRVFSWVAVCRRPPFRKLLVVLGALLLWLVISPLLIGSLYGLILLTSPQSFTGDWPFPDITSLAWSWATGSLLLNGWALLCYHSVFTREFWIHVGNAAIEADEDRADNRQAQDGDRDRRDTSRREEPANPDAWQGTRGRIGRFVNMLVRTLIESEWDVVDQDVLLSACAIPVARQIFTAIATPSIAFSGWLVSLKFLGQETANVVLPIWGEVENSLYHALVFRSFAVVTLLAQYAACNQEALRRWFQAAHRAARDGRYLEGQILMNYGPVD